MYNTYCGRVVGRDADVFWSSITDAGLLFAEVVAQYFDRTQINNIKKEEKSFNFSSMVVYRKILSNNYLEALERVEEFRCFLERKPAR